MRHAGRKALTFHRFVVDNGKHLGAHPTRYLNLAPVGGVQMPLRRRHRTQVPRLEADQLCLRVSQKSSESHRDRLGSLARHSLQTSEHTARVIKHCAFERV